VNDGCRKCQDGVDALRKGRRQALLFDEDVSLALKINTPRQLQILTMGFWFQ
jgi:hypothetical protein